ncbi:MAG: hypothetical protein RR653_01690 [Clostridia bacterium]
MTMESQKDLSCATKKRGIPLPLLAALALLLTLSLLIYLREFQYDYSDFRIHAFIAADFNFADLHTITSRLSYPLWHLCVSVLYKIGLPLAWAASSVSAIFKGLTLLLCYGILNQSTHKKLKPWLLTLASVALVLVTGLCLPWFNPTVYRSTGSPIGSPNVWHNPTQQAVTVAMLLCVPYLVHCWREYERLQPTLGKRVMLPWRKVLMLAFLLMLSLACKPTFMQALLPAAFAMFLVEWIRHKQDWRYFGQIILAFLPAAAYFLLQYLYYTGVVVEYTSGVSIGITLESMTMAVRNALLQCAFPLLALVCCYRKGMFKDRLLVLAVLMLAFSVLEAMAFRETGLRQGHGNFTWATNSSAFFLWVVMLGVYMNTLREDFATSAQGTTPVAALRKVGYGACALLLLWHVASGVVYLIYLFTTHNAF